MMLSKKRKYKKILVQGKQTVARNMKGLKLVNEEHVNPKICGGAAYHFVSGYIHTNLFKILFDKTFSQALVQKTCIASRILVTEHECCYFGHKAEIIFFVFLSRLF